jgi:hypothetical protein
VTALILAQIPDPHIAPAITANELALVRMNNYIVDGRAVRVVPLDAARARIPYLDRAVFGARHHPLALAVERDACDVGRVAFEGQDGVRVCGFDLVELDGVVASGGEEALVGGDAEAVDLGVGVRDCARADAGEGFPEADCVVVAGWVRSVFCNRS